MCFFFEIKGRSIAMSYKKKVSHIKGNETKPQLNRKNRKSTRCHTTTPWERNLQETTKASAVIQRCSTPKLEQPAASLDRNHSSSIMALSSSCRTHIVVDLPAATAKQNQILTLKDISTVWGLATSTASQHRSKTTLKQHSAAGHCFAKTC